MKTFVIKGYTYCHWNTDSCKDLSFSFFFPEPDNCVPYLFFPSLSKFSLFTRFFYSIYALSPLDFSVFHHLTFVKNACCVLLFKRMSSEVKSPELKSHLHHLIEILFGENHLNSLYFLISKIRLQRIPVQKVKFEGVALFKHPQK